jgi:hypothetical protein
MIFILPIRPNGREFHRLVLKNTRGVYMSSCDSDTNNTLVQPQVTFHTKQYTVPHSLHSKVSFTVEHVLVKRSKV